MKAEEQSELPTYKSVPYEDPNAKLTLEVQGAAKIGGSQNSMYRAAASDHLPVVTINQLGTSASLKVNQGNTFSATLTGDDRVAIKQFDAKTGKLVVEDDLSLGDDEHIAIDPKSGKPILATISVDNKFVYQDHFDKNGVLQFRTSPNNEDQFDAKGRLVSAKTTFPDFEEERGNVSKVISDFYDANKTIEIDTFPGSGQASYAKVDHSDGTDAYVGFDAKTGKPDLVVETDDQGQHYFNIDPRTGKASADDEMDFKSYWHLVPPVIY